MGTEPAGLIALIVVAVLGDLRLEVDPLELGREPGFVKRDPAGEAAGARRVVKLHRSLPLSTAGPAGRPGPRLAFTP